MVHVEANCRAPDMQLHFLLYTHRLRQAQHQPYILPAQALCTDGGCDEPFESYWVSNTRQLYCLAALEVRATASNRQLSIAAIPA
jgi:hypothetical protein